MGIDYKALNERLCVMDMAAALVDYIFRVQGGAIKRLDYNAAAKTLGCSRRTVARWVQTLVNNGVLHVARTNGKYGLQIAPELINQVN